VVILPNTACLDASQVAAIDEYVKHGGGVVASLDTSLFDEFGTPRENFALANVFGVDYRGLPAVTAEAREELDMNFAKSIRPDYWEKRKNVFDFQQDPKTWLNQGKMKTYVGEGSVTFKGPAVRVALKPGSTQWGTFRAKAAADAPVMPAVVHHRYGRGRVVYLAAGFDAAYYLYSYPYQRLILKHAIQWVADSPQPVKVEAPMCVHATLMRQARKTSAGDERLVLHLFSDLNTTAHHALPQDDIPLREEVVPIHNIRVTFASGYRFSKSHLEPEGLVLKPETTAQGTVVTVPHLDVHSMVVAELQR